MALYFACRSRGDSDASVWVINYSEYLRKYWNIPLFVLSVDSQAIVRQIIQREIVLFGKPNEQSELSEYPYPWIYKPKYREERMKLQFSVFMLWGSLRLSFDKIVKSDDYMELSADSDNKTNENGTLCAIAVPADAKSKILQQLNDIGINEKFIFPGLDGVGKTIAEKYSAK